jgi:CubicO group peptidase (beta-lactamase class C family)
MPDHSRTDFSAARLERMHAALRRHVDSGGVPGLVALVHQRGREHVEAIGTMAFGGEAPVRRDTIFRLASSTKPITAAGAMILVEECKVRLDDPVDEWLPELADRRVLRTIESPLDDTVPAKRPITLRDLLTFRSGYGEVAFIAPASPLQQALGRRGCLSASGRSPAHRTSSCNAWAASPSPASRASDGSTTWAPRSSVC